MGPTVGPTTSPSPGPTSSPSAGPTDATDNPTASPSLGPTGAPTVGPTTSPSQGPTLSPSAGPTDATENPTVSPSLGPTAPPTVGPTFHPTTQPTAGPTNGGCNTQTGNIQASSGSLTVTVTVTNNDTNAKNLKTLTISWPSNNGNLMDVYLGGNLLYDGNLIGVSCCSVTLTSNEFESGNANKLEGVNSGGVEDLVLNFENEVDASGYSISSTCTSSGGDCGSCISY